LRERWRQAKGGIGRQYPEEVAQPVAPSHLQQRFVRSDQAIRTTVARKFEKLLVVGVRAQRQHRDRVCFRRDFIGERRVGRQRGLLTCCVQGEHRVAEYPAELAETAIIGQRQQVAVLDPRSQWRVAAVGKDEKRQEYVGVEDDA
jgi:hypothetical protein